jgi:hypothetical protein
MGADKSPEPPMRDVEHVACRITSRSIPALHELTAFGANSEDQDNEPLPAPEQPRITRHTDVTLVEEIERHVEFIKETEKGTSAVRLPAGFVRHYLSRDDGALPTVRSIATLPIVLGNGTLLARTGLDRDRGIVFRIPKELLRILPKREDCTPSRVAAAMRFLVREWFVDVATDFPGRCTAIACTSAIIQRAVLPSRPVYFVTAGQRGGGKTTLLNMVSTAGTGLPVTAAAWSANEEERRKAILAYLASGIPFLVWDNIKRGSVITCQTSSATARRSNIRIASSVSANSRWCRPSPSWGSRETT